jgi:hypothetical protein
MQTHVEATAEVELEDAGTGQLPGRGRTGPTASRFRRAMASMSARVVDADDAGVPAWAMGIRAAAGADGELEDRLPAAPRELPRGRTARPRARPGGSRSRRRNTRRWRGSASWCGYHPRRGTMNTPNRFPLPRPPCCRGVDPGAGVPRPRRSRRRTCSSPARAGTRLYRIPGIIVTGRGRCWLIARRSPSARRLGPDRRRAQAQHRRRATRGNAAPPRRRNAGRGRA